MVVYGAFSSAVVAGLWHQMSGFDVILFNLWHVSVTNACDVTSLYIYLNG